MIGIVVVSHSRALALAVVALANEMVPADARPVVAVAAGLDETTFGTDAAAIAEAITSADSPEGVLVLVDLGSAVLSAEMALEFVDPSLAQRVVVSPAPLVEGLMAAMVTASTGADLDQVAQEARDGLLAKQSQLDQPDGTPSAGTGPAQASFEVVLPTEAGFPGETAAGPTLSEADRPDRVFTWTIRNPHGLHARPAATLVASLRGIDARVAVANLTAHRGPVAASSLTALLGLGLRHGDAMRVEFSGPEAERAADALRRLAEGDFGEPGQDGASSQAARPSGSADRSPLTSPLPSADQPAQGDGRQIVIGPIHHQRLAPDTDRYVGADPATERARLDDALNLVQAMLDGGETDLIRQIHHVQRLTLSDESLLDQLRGTIDQGGSAVEAVRQQFGVMADQLETIDDPYLKDRAEDIRGLQTMILRALVGEEPKTETSSGVIVLDELDPLTAAALDPTRCLGIITTKGGATGHGVIIAQSRGFALVTGHREASEIADGTLVGIDPVLNRLWVNPTDDELMSVKQEQARRRTVSEQTAASSRLPAITRSGTRVLVEANISSLADARLGNLNGAEGSGLVRTEVLFGDWDHAPTSEEQAEIFVQIGQSLGDQTITIRTWDPGGDKPLAFLPQEPEVNPMLGERGIRAMRRLPDLFDSQLAAVLLASRRTPVRVMFPMIATPQSVIWARSHLAEVQRRCGGAVEVGMMVETPAAALGAEQYRALIDFVSIGTNDLAQYTMAADRGNPEVAQITAADRSAVYTLIGMTARAFRGSPVAVCGDYASQPETVATLLGLGVTELSVKPPLVGVIKQAVRATP